MPGVVTVIPATKRPDTLRQGKKILNVAAYCRVSTDMEEQLTSYENQINYYTEKIKTTPEWKLAGVFADRGKSGTSMKKRTEFLKMIELCKKDKIDLILTKSVSRFGRNTAEMLEIVRMLRTKGIGVIFEKENIRRAS